MKKFVWVAVTSLVAAFALIQLVPYRITNSSVRDEPHWDSPQTRELAVRACYACHSNEVEKPWYAHVAPVSWLLNRHVREGREALNLSEWNRGGGENESDDVVESIREGSMPPSYYTWFGLHSEAKLTPAERSQLVHGIERTLNR
jgi:hypothetical protein